MCVEWCCTFDEEGLVFPSRGVGPAARDTGGRRDPALPIQEHEVVKAIPEEHVSQRVVEPIARSVPVDRIKD